jgi:hypothetical protein
MDLSVVGATAFATSKTSVKLYSQPLMFSYVFHNGTTCGCSQLISSSVCGDRDHLCTAKDSPPSGGGTTPPPVYYDCNGDRNGAAFKDDCGVCSGGKSGHVANSDKSCYGVCFGSKNGCEPTDPTTPSPGSLGSTTTKKTAVTTKKPPATTKRPDSIFETPTNMDATTFVIITLAVTVSIPLIVFGVCVRYESLHRLFPSPLS